MIARVGIFVGRVGAVWVQLALPVVYLLGTPVVWLLHRLVAAAVRRVVGPEPERTLKGRPLLARLVTHLAAAPTGNHLVRGLLVVAIAQFQQLLLVLFSLLTCEPTLQVVSLMPALSCASPTYAALQALAVALLSLLCALLVLPVGWLWLYRRRQRQRLGGRLFASAEDTGDLEPLMARWGVLMADYRPAVCWWEAWMLGRRVLLLAVRPSSVLCSVPSVIVPISPLTPVTHWRLIGGPVCVTDRV